MTITKKSKEMLIQLISDLNISYSTSWKNFSENQQIDNCYVLKIRNVRQLQSVLEKIDAYNQSISSEKQMILRVAAGGRKQKYSESFSFTPCVEADVIIQLTGKEFKKIERTKDNHIVKVGAAVQIGELDKTLYEKFNLTLPTASLIGHVTAVGLAANAGHGTGRDQPSFAGLIKSMKICLPNGKIVTIDASHPDFETIRGAHLGVFGVVLEMEIECIQAKKLQCVVESRSLAEFLEEVKAGLFLHDPYVSVMYVPTYQADELTNTKIHNVIIYRWRAVSKEHDNLNKMSDCDRFNQYTQIKLLEDFSVTDIFRSHPNIIPYFMKYIVSRFAVGEKDQLSVGPWHEVAHYQTAFPRDIDDADYLFEVSHDSHEIVEALTKVVNTLSDFAKQGQYPISNAIYLRYFLGTNGGLSTSQHGPDKHICGFDLVSTPGLPGSCLFKEKISDYFLNALKAKPHPGKYIPSYLDFEQIYGKEVYDKFIKVLMRWHDEHDLEIEKNPLFNRFMRKQLKMPVIDEKKTETNIQFCNESKMNQKAIIQTVLPHIDCECEQGHQLAKHLQSLCTDTHVTNKAMLFKHYANHLPDSSCKEVRRKKCCVIL